MKPLVPETIGVEEYGKRYGFGLPIHNSELRALKEYQLIHLLL